MGVVTMKRLDGIFEVVRAYLPKRVESSGDFEDWNVVAPAFVAIAADLLEGIMASPPPRGRVRAEVFARSLAEYVIAFAWLAAADPDERSGRLRSFVRDEFIERQKGERKLADQIGGRPAYDWFFDPETERPGGPFPRELLNAETRARLESLRADDSIPALPNAFDMAFKADEKWMPEIELVQHNPFAVIYFILFTSPSFVSHPSVTAVDRVVVGDPPNLVIGFPTPLGESEMPYGQAFLTFVNMLLVASRSLGWPAEEQVHAALDRT